MPREVGARETVSPLAVASMKRYRRLWYQGDRMLDIKREIVTLAEWPDALKVGEPCIITDEPVGELLRFCMRTNGVITCDSTEFCAAVKADDRAEADAFMERLTDLDIEPRVLHVFAGNEAPVTLFAFVQAEEPRVRIADCYIGDAEHGRWLLDSGETELTEVCAALALPRVGVYFRGPWDPAVIEGMSGGWVVKPAIERVDPKRGRVAVFVPRVVEEAAP